LAEIRNGKRGCDTIRERCSNTELSGAFLVHDYHHYLHCVKFILLTMTQQFRGPVGYINCLQSLKLTSKKKKRPQSKTPMTNSYKYTQHTKFGKHYIASYVNRDPPVTFSHFHRNYTTVSLFQGEGISLRNTVRTSLVIWQPFEVGYQYARE
jgi:hypothetical protein